MIKIDEIVISEILNNNLYFLNNPELEDQIMQDVYNKSLEVI